MKSMVIYYHHVELLFSVNDTEEEEEEENCIAKKELDKTLLFNDAIERIRDEKR